MDFYQFWIAGHALAASGDADLYSSDGRATLAALGDELAARPEADGRLRAAVTTRTHIETFSTPFFYWSFALLETDRYDRDFTWHGMASLLAACGATLFLALSTGWRPSRALLLLAVVLLGCKPLLSDFQVGNVAAFQLGLVAICLALLRLRESRLSTFGAGAVAAIAVMLKPNLAPALALPALVRGVQRQWAGCAAYTAGSAAGALVVIAGTAAAAGSLQPWVRWLAAVRHLESGSDLSVQTGNVSLARFVTDLGGPNLSPLLLAAGIAVIVWAVAGSRRSVTSFRDDVLFVGLGSAVVLAGSRLSWLHYHVLLLPVVAVVLSPEAIPKTMGRASLLLAGLVFWLGAPLDVLRWGGPALPAIESFVAVVLISVAGLHVLRTAPAREPVLTRGEAR